MSASLIDYIFISSEITSEGRRITKLDQILLNGNNIAIVSILHSCRTCPPPNSFSESTDWGNFLSTAAGSWWLSWSRMRLLSRLCGFAIFSRGNVIVRWKAFCKKFIIFGDQQSASSEGKHWVSDVKLWFRFCSLLVTLCF